MALLFLIIATRALSHTGGLQHNGTFICYPWPQRPSVKQSYYITMALLFVMHGHKGPQPHRLITAQGQFYFFMHGHKGPQPHRLITA